jgi:aspartyl-tRNA(Asn)/glutamyl-tRNA(Gln) amidotransferase subunit A
MGSIFEPLITSGKVDQLADKPQIAGLKASLDLPAKDYLKAMRIRRLIQEEVSKFFGQFDVLIAPGRANIATKIDQRIDVPPPGMPTPPADTGLRGIIQMGNLAGLPALVLPCGFASNMPVALQVVGVPFSENLLLAVGREFQSKTNWHKRRPPDV